MTIKDMELQTGLARANIRYYEAEGLITPERAENGYRDYSQEDAETLLRVKLLRALGLTVGQIKAVVRGETEHMIPAVPEFVLKTDAENGIITVRLIEGM